MTYEYTLSNFPGSYFYWKTNLIPSVALHELRRVHGKHLIDFIVKVKEF